MSPSARTSIVFGLSGVGKTTACLHYLETSPACQYISVSAVLRDISGDAKIWSLPRKEMQIRLASEVAARFRPDCERLIDAHSLIETDEDSYEVPVDAIRLMEPTTLVFLQQAPNEIYRRRKSDRRTRLTAEVAELAILQERARDIVEGYSKELGISLIIAEADDPAVLVHILSA